MSKQKTRRTRIIAPTVVADLGAMVDALIKENRTLKRQLAKLEAAGVSPVTRGRSANPLATGLTKLNRQLERALAPSRPARAPRARAATPVRSPRKPVSPEVAAKRLEGLAKARAARAAKKAAAAPPLGTSATPIA